MTRDEFAALLNGREYGKEMTGAEEKAAKESNLLVVFGASDDLTEFRGVIRDEVGAYDGMEFFVVHSAKGPRLEYEDDENEPSGKGVLIKAIWCPKGQGGETWASWLIETAIPFAPFDIMEDGDLYCRGAVIDATDLLPKQRVIASGTISRREVCFEFSDDVTAADIASIHAHLAGWSRQ